MRIYKETLIDGRTLEIPYDETKIKDFCVDCESMINENRIKGYETRGNYCSSCNAKYKNCGKMKEETGSFYEKLLKQTIMSDKAYSGYGNK